MNDALLEVLAAWPPRSHSLRLLRLQQSAIEEASGALAKFAEDVACSRPVEAVMAVLQAPAVLLHDRSTGRFVEAGAVETDAGQLAVAVIWEAHENSGGKTTARVLEALWADLDDDEDTAILLRSIGDRFVEVDAPKGARRDLLVLDAADPASHALNAGRVSARAAVFGVKLDVVRLTASETKERHALSQRISSGGYERLLHAGSAAWLGGVVREFELAGGVALEIDSTRTITVDDVEVAARQATPEVTADGRGWEAVSGALGTTEAILFSAKGARSAGGGTYQSPGRLADHLAMLAMAGERFSEAKGNIGVPLKEFFTAMGLDFAPDDKSLRTEDIQFTHDGETYEARPHICIDDAKGLSQAGRIYFAIDQVRHRFIVHHIGGHL